MFRCTSACGMFRSGRALKYLDRIQGDAEGHVFGAFSARQAQGSMCLMQCSPALSQRWTRFVRGLIATESRREGGRSIQLRSATAGKGSTT
jgi:hypothetical protein